MSSYVDKDYFYYLRGRELLLYNELVYPDEDIANGLRLEYTKVSEPFISEALETTLAYASGTNISFSASAIISTTSNFWVNNGFLSGDKIRVKGSSSNDGDYTISGILGSSNEQASTSEGFTTESAGQRITVNQIPKEVTSPDSTSHINLNKMLSLAVVDYCKAMMSERNGEIDKKEYFMKEFYGKLADNESNKRIISVASSISAFAVK